MSVVARSASALGAGVLLVLAVAACSSAPAATVPPERFIEVCLKQPDDIVLADVAFLKDTDTRSAELRRLANQVGAKREKAQNLVAEYGQSVELDALVTTAERYEAALAQYEANAEQFGDPLGDATLAEGAFYAACSAAMP